MLGENSPYPSIEETSITEHKLENKGGSQFLSGSYWVKIHGKKDFGMFIAGDFPPLCVIIGDERAKCRAVNVSI